MVSSSLIQECLLSFRATYPTVNLTSQLSFPEILTPNISKTWDSICTAAQDTVMEGHLCIDFFSYRKLCPIICIVSVLLANQFPSLLIPSISVAISHTFLLSFTLNDKKAFMFFFSHCGLSKNLLSTRFILKHNFDHSSYLLIPGVGNIVCRQKLVANANVTIVFISVGKMLWVSGINF